VPSTTASARLMVNPLTFWTKSHSILRPLTFEQPMSFQRKSAFTHPPRPPLPRADAARIIQQPVLRFLGRQPGELGVQFVLGQEERLLPVQHGRVALRP
jgi:hypothetical protein